MSRYSTCIVLISVLVTWTGAASQQTCDEHAKTSPDWTRLDGEEILAETSIPYVKQLQSALKDYNVIHKTSLKLSREDGNRDGHPKIYDIYVKTGDPVTQWCVVYGAKPANKKHSKCGYNDVTCTGEMECITELSLFISPLLLQGAPISNVNVVSTFCK